MYVSTFYFFLFYVKRLKCKVRFAKRLSDYMERYYEEIREHDPVDLNGLDGAESEDEGRQIHIIFLKVKYVTNWGPSLSGKFNSKFWLYRKISSFPKDDKLWILIAFPLNNLYLPLDFCFPEYYCGDHPDLGFIYSNCLKNSTTTNKHHKTVECGISPLDALPCDQSFYTYGGSLTTPPCYETVQWVVYKCPIAVSKKVTLIFIDDKRINVNLDDLNGICEFFWYHRRIGIYS